eukprot:4417366-Karenia_brevis.AAC.1
MPVNTIFDTVEIRPSCACYSELPPAQRLTHFMLKGWKLELHQIQGSVFIVYEDPKFRPTP